MSTEVPAYRAVALQTTTRAVNGLGVTEARQTILDSIERVGEQAAAAVAWYGPDTKLVVLPEYTFTGFPMGDTIEGWAEKGAFDPEGKEYDALAAIAQRLGVFLAVNNYETDRNFPGLYFQGSVILGPSGDVALRYRRLHSLYSPSPYDVWDRYLDVYGMDAVLPVAKTEIGNLAAIASEEILYPELSRAFALRGAEVFVHSTSEATGADLGPKAIARRARAIENLAYVVSANSAGITGIALSNQSTDGGSEILDHQGRVLVRAATGETMVAGTEIDLAPLRRARNAPSMGNLLARVKTGLWAEEYARHDVDRANGLLNTPAERAFFVQRHKDTIARLRETGVVR